MQGQMLAYQDHHQENELATQLKKKSREAETVQKVPICHWDLCCYQENSLPSRAKDL